MAMIRIIFLMNSKKNSAPRPWHEKMGLNNEPWEAVTSFPVDPIALSCMPKPDQ